MPMLCVSYTRKSRALGDPDDPELLSHHRTVILRMASEDGAVLPPAAMIEEVGSGDSLALRPRFVALLQQIAALPPSTGGVLYCTELARLGRGDLAEVGHIMQVLSRAGIKVRTPGRTYDLSRPDDELMYAIISMLSRHELSKYKELARMRLDEKTRTGQVTNGSAPYGYRWDRNAKNLIPVEPEFTFCRNLFADAITASVETLSSRYGLNRTRIYWMLRNPVYCGWPARHCQALPPGDPRGHRHLRREEYIWPEAAGSYPPACTRDHWEAVQDALSDRRCAGRHESSPGWCRDRVRFAGIPGPIGVDLRPSVSGPRPVYVVRKNRSRLAFIEQSKVHDAVTQSLLKPFSCPEALRRARERYRCQIEAERREKTREMPLHELQQRLSRERSRLSVLVEEAAGLDAEEVSATRAAATRVKERIEVLKRALSATQHKEPEEPVLPAMGAMLAAWPQLLASHWPGLEAAVKRQIVNECVDEIVISWRGDLPPRDRRFVAAVRLADWLAEIEP